MRSYSCTEYIEVLKARLENEKEASKWKEFHLREEIRILHVSLADKDVRVCELEKELLELRSAAPDSLKRAVSPPLKASIPKRSLIRVICSHILPTRRRSQQLEEELG